MSDKSVLPFLKWIGGKRQLIPTISQYLPDNITEYQYVEPFIGGGALLFHLQPQNAIINDFNEELINVYLTIKNNLQELLTDLKTHQNQSEYYYYIRGLDRDKNFKELSNVKRASRIIYLNKTCFNGLYRVNNKGEYNSSFGAYKQPNIINETTLVAVNHYLNDNNISINCGDYSKILQQIDDKFFVYLDPPYHPISETSNFSGYIQGGWSDDDQIELRKQCDELNKKNIKFLLSNSSSQFIKEQYQHYDIITVKANRRVNTKGDGRGEIDEVLIKNY